jgi:mxaK protein
MTGDSAPTRIRYGIAGLDRFWQHSRTTFLIGVVLALALAAAAATFLLGLNAARNRTIAALANGQDRAVAIDAAPEVLFARVYFLLAHNRLNDVAPLVNMLDLRATPTLRAELHYDIANARLKLAFDKIENGDFDAAGALVGLAREDYREALQFNPDNWDARFNFDVASRLLREYPSFGFTPDERRRGPRPLWTELPNTPRGEP